MTASSGNAGSRRGVLVTGGSRGLGAAVCRHFASACGDRVAVHCGRSRAEAEALTKSLPGDGHVVVQGDLADPDAVQGFVHEAIEMLGRIDVLVNNAALFAAEPGAGRRFDLGVAESSYEEWRSGWRRTFEVNVLGTANVTYLVARHMIAVPPGAGLPGGRIITVGSRGAYRGEPKVPAYGASKAAVHAMSQSLAVSLAPYGIACTAIAPGFIETEMAAQALSGPAGDAIRAQSPFDRVATVDEVSRAVVALADPDAEWASGAVLDFNGASYLH